MLDYRPVHIDDIEPAVGAVAERDRPKPRVSRGEKLLVRLTALRHRYQPVLDGAIPLHQRSGRFAGKETAIKLCRQQIAFIAVDAAGGGKLTGVEVARRPGIDQWKDTTLLSRRHDRHPPLGNR